MTNCSRNWLLLIIPFGGKCTPSRCRTGMRLWHERDNRSRLLKARSSMPSIPDLPMEATMRANERGIALLLCLLALVLLTGLGIGLLYMSDAETQVNSNYRGSQQAYFAATAGLQNVRERMTPANTGAHALTLPNLMPGNAGSVLYVTNPAGGS